MKLSLQNQHLSFYPEGISVSFFEEKKIATSLDFFSE